MEQTCLDSVLNNPSALNFEPYDLLTTTSDIATRLRLVRLVYDLLDSDSDSASTLDSDSDSDSTSDSDSDPGLHYCMDQR
jgi:hypothetical protein